MGALAQVTKFGILSNKITDACRIIRVDILSVHDGPLPLVDAAPPLKPHGHAGSSSGLWHDSRSGQRPSVRPVPTTQLIGIVVVVEMDR